MGKNILIPHHLVVRILELLGYWDTGIFQVTTALSMMNTAISYGK